MNSGIAVGHEICDDEILHGHCYITTLGKALTLMALLSW